MLEKKIIIVVHPITFLTHVNQSGIFTTYADELTSKVYTTVQIYVTVTQKCNYFDTDLVIRKLTTL